MGQLTATPAPPTPPWIPEFRDVQQLADGTWRAVHHSGQAVTAPTWRSLLYVKAPAVRCARAWGQA